MSKTFKEFVESYFIEFEEILQEATNEFINENDLTEDQKEFLLSEAKLYGPRTKRRKKGVLRLAQPQTNLAKKPENPLNFMARRLPVDRYR